MLRVFAWSGVAVASVAAALFVPIDSSVLKAVGLPDGDRTGFGREAALQSSVPLASQYKIVSGPTPVPGKLEVRTPPAPNTSPYQAKSDTAAHQPRPIQRLAIAAAPRLASAPFPAATPAPVTSGVVIRNLQRELRRVGCYSGRIDGDWGPASRFAMAAFTKVVNAALPTERPDVILLSLVRRHAGSACGPSRATPQTVVAATPRAKVQGGVAWRARVTPAQPDATAPTTGTTTPPEPPRIAQRSPQLTGAPRIVRSDGTHVREVTIARKPDVRAPAVAATIQPHSPFSANRMSLGIAVPTPTEVQPGTRNSSTVQHRAKRRKVTHRYKPRPRVHRRARSVRRYSRRWRRGRSWQSRAFGDSFSTN